MQNKPLVSVVLPVYNGEEFLAQSIQSVINQTYTNWELIIVDDCSTDNSSKIAKDFALKDERIRVVKNGENLKLPASLNRGFENAKGEYYTWTSDDNEYYPEAFEKMVNFLENNSYYGMVYAQINVEKDGILQDYVWCDEATTPNALLTLCVPGACFMYRKLIAQMVGKYDESCFLNEDHDYWLRILLKTKIANLDEILYLYRLRKTSLTGSKAKEIKKGKIKLLRKYRKIYTTKFPNIKNKYKYELIFDNLIEKNISFKQAKHEIPTKKFYKILKQEFVTCKNPEYLKYICLLGFKYFIKALLLVLKTKSRKTKDEF